VDLVQQESSLFLPGPRSLESGYSLWMVSDAWGIAGRSGYTSILVGTPSFKKR